ncbi:uncharacterized protein PG986_014447 [Apiospora aurea]|uniref:F-box domain-containing protein n=1 Tax=Apiospora aurea TaxID=335848 RepID=A0ABR1PT03_9PEZI
MVRTRKRSRLQETAPSTAARKEFSHLASLPLEIWKMVLENIDHQPTINALSLTNSAVNAIVIPHLYRRIVITRSHDPISKRFECLLTTGQKKQLRKKENDEGQQERCPNELNQTTKPIVATHVRQLIINDDPYKDTEVRCIEKILNNLNQLKIIDTSILTVDMAKFIASLKHLQALRVTTACGEAVLEPIRQVKGIKHLRFACGTNRHHPNIDVAQSLIENSASTLRSLTGVMFFPFKVESGSTKAQYPLIMLKTLHILKLPLDRENTERMLKFVDFVKLEDLLWDDNHNDPVLLYERLAVLFGTASPPSLRSLRLTIRINFEVGYRFIASFNTLRTLSVANNCIGPSDIMLESILKHKGLRILELRSECCVPPCLSAREICVIVDGLPELRELAFVPKEEEMASAPTLIEMEKLLTQRRLPRLRSVGSWFGRDI